MSIVSNGVDKALDFGGQVVSQIAKLPAHSGRVYACSMHTMTGIAGTVLSCLTGGKVKRFNDIADEVFYANDILPSIFRAVLVCFNEKAFEESDLKEPNEDAVRYFGWSGYCVEKFNQSVDFSTYLKAQYNGDSKSTVFEKHFITRGYFFMYSLVLVISRIADFILGIGAALGAFACLGRWDKANKFAVENLAVFGIISDLSLGLRGVINPKQFV